MGKQLPQRIGGRGGGVACPAADGIEARPDGAGVGRAARQGAGEQSAAARVGNGCQNIVLTRLHGLHKKQQHGRTPHGNKAQIRRAQQQARAGKLPFPRALRRQQLGQKQHARQERGSGFAAEIVQIAAAADGNAACGVRAAARGGADDEKQPARKGRRPPPPHIRQPGQNGAAEGGIEAFGIGNEFRAARAAARFLEADGVFRGEHARFARRGAFYQAAQALIIRYGHGAGEIFVASDAGKTVPPSEKAAAARVHDVAQNGALRLLRLQ